MNEQDMHVSLWAWAGWFLFAIALGLLYRLYSSDPHVALRRMRLELDKARETIADLQALESSLKRSLEEQSIHLAEAQADNQELRQRLAVVEKANEVQNNMLDRMERYQKELQGKCDDLYVRLVKLEARQDS